MWRASLLVAALVAAGCGAPCPEHSHADQTADQNGACEVDPCYLPNDAGVIEYAPGAYGYGWGCVASAAGEQVRIK